MWSREPPSAPLSPSSSLSTFPFQPFFCFPTCLLPLSLTSLKNPHRYGSTDGQSPNCNTATAACGFYNYPGFDAAASQNLYGAPPNAGAGPQCHHCWLLTPQKDGNGQPIQGANAITVKINNLCPAQGNPLCSQATLSDTNSLGIISVSLLPALLPVLISYSGFLVHSTDRFIANCTFPLFMLHRCRFHRTECLCRRIVL